MNQSERFILVLLIGEGRWQTSFRRLWVTAQTLT
jgi:hypothetical protein